MADVSDPPPAIANAMRQAHQAQMRLQTAIDRTTPFAARRWAATGGLLALFMLRIVLSQGWYIVCYALFIYLLNLFLAFLQPKFDPGMYDDLASQDIEEGEPGLPTSASGASKPAGSGGLMSGVFGNPGPQNGDAAGGEDEFRPFIRRLPEFKFWLSATQAIVISLLCTMTRLCDVPVYWPILLVYFFILFGITMKRQIKHMVKYRYVPFDLGKKVYK
ncbi:retrieval of early ER protein Rer1 [Microstroma glucosiphilum]|uniref:Protein RER1 n=1 Tax=Pseudomicrostroma glucosiphilum TaxID=1684307 RepID=A0A316U6Y1_9BASI|nr:retrieval of early ER protein Rer1 [Pseudomicrostroma glucosiphilum]PWN18695.1 retrieval of early ER protein Rer1 [Pseudomicrostroma glucosiphilum]